MEFFKWIKMIFIYEYLSFSIPGSLLRHVNLFDVLNLSQVVIFVGGWYLKAWENWKSFHLIIQNLN